MRKRRPLMARFWAKVKVEDVADPEACWLWDGGLDADGYGALGVGTREEGTVKSHRLSYAVLNHPIPDDLCVLHRCDVPACVNPDHLFLGTRVDNVEDMWAKGRQQDYKRRARANT